MFALSERVLEGALKRTETSPIPPEPIRAATSYGPRREPDARAIGFQGTCEGEYTPGRDLVGEVHAAEDQTLQNHAEKSPNVLQQSQLGPILYFVWEIHLLGPLK